MARVLLKGGCVLTLGAKTPNLPSGDVLIDGERIVEIGPGLRARDAELVDATDMIVMPGFVDAHRHTWTTLFRNAGAVSPDLDRYEPDDLYAATLLGLLGAAEAGITTVVDCAVLPPEPAYAEAATQAHADAGLRTLRAVGAHAGRRHVHVADSAAFQEIELGPDVALVGCAGLTEEDFDAVAAAGASVVLTPSTAMAAGSGLPPVQALIDRGIRPGLGVDDELLAPGDLFAQMRAVQAVQHASVFERKLAGKAGVPTLLSTREAIRFATIDGADAVGLGELTGSLEPGKAADIVVLRTDTPNISPVNDPIGAVVWGMDPSNVSWVFAAGRPVVRGGQVEADVAEVRQLALTAWKRVAGSTGDLVGGAR